MRKQGFVEYAEAVVLPDAIVRASSGENAPTLPRDYRHRLEHCRDYFGTRALHRIDGPTLKGFRIFLTERGLKPSAIKPIMSFVRVVLRSAHEDGLLDRIPTMPHVGVRASPRPWFNRDDYRLLLTTMGRVERGKPEVIWKGHKVDWQLRAMSTFMVNSFLRPGDLFALKHEHVTVVDADDDGPAYLRLAPPPSKNHDASTVTMPVGVPIYLRTTRLQKAEGFGAPGDYVFMPKISSREHAKKVAQAQFRLVLAEAGLSEATGGAKHSMYSLRHSAIMFRLLNGDVDALTLARACRTSVEMIDRFYASGLTAEMNRDKLHSFRRPTRFLDIERATKSA